MASKQPWQACEAPWPSIPAALQTESMSQPPPLPRTDQQPQGQPAQLLWLQQVCMERGSCLQDPVDGDPVGPSNPHTHTASLLPVPSLILASPLPVGRRAPNPAHLLHFSRASRDDPIPHTRWEIACTFRRVISVFVFFPKRSR